MKKIKRLFKTIRNTILGYLYLLLELVVKVLVFIMCAIKVLSEKVLGLVILLIVFMIICFVSVGGYTMDDIKGTFGPLVLVAVALGLIAYYSEPITMKILDLEEYFQNKRNKLCLKFYHYLLLPLIIFALDFGFYLFNCYSYYQSIELCFKSFFEYNAYFCFFKFIVWKIKQILFDIKFSLI